MSKDSIEAQENNLNLLQKLVEIRKNVTYFKKDTKGYKYEYVSGSQVLSKIKSKMDELGVILQPLVGDDPKIEKDGVDWCYTSKMTYIWINADNPEDCLETPWFLCGTQNDPSKAFGSALTYSERYFLLKFFCVPTDDIDPDASQGSKQSHQKPAFIPKQQYSASNQVHEDSPAPAPAHAPDGDYVFPGGKYQGKRVSDIVKLDKGYLQFLVKPETKTSDSVKDICRAYLDK